MVEVDTPLPSAVCKLCYYRRVCTHVGDLNKWCKKASSWGLYHRDSEWCKKKGL